MTLGSLRPLLVGLNALPLPFGALTLRHWRGVRAVDREWAALARPALDDVGEVRTLTILPLVEAQAARPDLATEPGVSYLVTADETRVLFDVGFDRDGTAPFARNVRALLPEGLRPAAVVVSHAHIDHVGTGATPSVRGELRVPADIDLGTPRLLAPAPLAFRGRPAEVTTRPARIAPGVWTTDPLPRHLYFLGLVREQSLAIRVAGKGLVVIVGCGHPGVGRIVTAALARFGGPLHAVVGGLHYPLTDSRLKGPLGFPFQMYVGTGHPPWRPVSEADVRAGIDALQAHRPALVALSPHDSCDAAIARFRAAFGERHRDLRVGEAIAV